MTTHHDWTLTEVLKLDEAAPGLAGHFLRASDERRHVMAAYLAARRRLPEQAQEAEFLIGARHTHILRAAYDIVPAGLRGALGRCGAQVHHASFYTDLHGKMSSSRDVARLVMRLPHVNPERLAIAKFLPDALRSPTLTMLLRDPDEAQNMAELFKLFTEAGADAAALVGALRRAGARNEVRCVWRSQLERLPFPAQPLPRTGTYEPVESARDLKLIALSFRNCVRRYLSDCLEGQVAFATFRASQQKLVIHLRRRSNLWFLDSCHAYANRRVDPDARSEAIAFLSQHGVHQFVRKSPNAGKWEPLRDIIARWELEHDLDGGWG